MEGIQTNDVPGESVSSTAQNPRMAGFWERFLALIIDSIIVSLVTFPVGFGLGIMQSLDTIMSGSTSAMYAGSYWISSTFGIAAQFLYFGWFYVNKGQSLGKMAMKIKVVRSSDLKYLGWGEVALRDILGKMVSGILFGLGYLWYFMSEKRQTWHDIIASTYVVKTDDAGNLLMDGPSSYKKEPVKTFGCCIAYAVVTIGFFALIIWGFVLAGDSLSNEIKKQQMDVNIQNDFNMELNGDQQQFDSAEDMRRYFEENFPEETDQLEPDSGGSPTPTL